MAAVKKEAIDNILSEDERRKAEMFSPFNPYTGEGAILERKELLIDDFFLPRQLVPLRMWENEEIQLLAKHGSIRGYVLKVLKRPYNESVKAAVSEMIIRLRCEEDFCFWAASFAYIANKDGGDHILFKLRKPQRKLVEHFEMQRLAGRPIRLILLKARQWGGSTTVQIYMAWLQFCHKKGLNSLICAHVGKSSAEIEDMFRTLITNYPAKMLHDIGEASTDNETKWEGVGGVQGIHRVPQRNCKIKVGTAEMPESCRGGAYSLVHCSEVGLWKKTEGKSPEDIAQSAMSGILLAPYTMIVLESTAKGMGNYFHREYVAAAEGKSQFDAMFVAWWEIEMYRLEFAEEASSKPEVHRTTQPDAKMLTRREFAERLYKERKNATPKDDRSVSGTYLWWLWEIGASLESIYWYVEERKKYSEQGRMASEYPSDAQEAFVNSGANVFDKALVAKLKPTCKPPRWKGELEGRAKVGEIRGFAGLQELVGIGERGVLEDLKFCEDSTNGNLSVWEKPEPDVGDEYVRDRYLVVVDVGGRGTKADWSVICVFDRLWMIDGGRPTVVAQWYGHIDMDLLAWKSAQIAKWYNNALLVIESNTLETKDKDRYVDGDQTSFILLQIKEYYDNLYARKQTQESIADGAPVKYGFHTNVSTKPMVISTLVKVIREQLYTERDELTLFEYNCYERKPNGSYGATTGNHDDKLMTRAIGLHICFYEMDMPRWERKVRKYVQYYRNRIVTEAMII